MPSSDQLHNENCFYYLCQVFAYTSETLLKHFSKSLKDAGIEVSTLDSPFISYQSDYPYGDLYTRFMQFLDDKLDTLYEDESLRESIEDCLNAVYFNDTSLLERTYEQVVKPVLAKQKPLGWGPQQAISRQMKDQGARVNDLSPSQEGKVVARFNATFVQSEFKPQHRTSLPAIRHYKHQTDKDAIEIRMGTQGQRHDEEDDTIVRVAPVFKHWVAARNKKDPEAIHLYFNNLPRDRADKEGKKEVAISHELERWADETPGIEVITLPADKGLMNKTDYRNTAQTCDLEQEMEVLLNIACKNSDGSMSLPEIKDFHVPRAIRDLLIRKAFSQDAENANDKTLMAFYLSVSLGEILGTESKTRQFISPAERQAIWFHFTKCVLPCFIIDAVKPTSFNFSCKHGIDRAGVSSAYYNLMKSFEQGRPMSRAEFEKALHAAAAYVNGRGLNHHLKMIWNAIDCYVRAHHEALLDEKKAWLVEWRDQNCPHSRVDDVLADSIRFSNKRIEAIEPVNARHQVAQDIMTELAHQAEAGASGRRLMLRVSSMTPALLANPGVNYKEPYQALSDSINSEYPRLKQLAGLMKSLVGLLLYAPSFGHSMSLFHQGQSTYQAGKQQASRHQMVTSMGTLSGRAP